MYKYKVQVQEYKYKCRVSIAGFIICYGVQSRIWEKWGQPLVHITEKSGSEIIVEVLILINNFYSSVFISIVTASDLPFAWLKQLQLEVLCLFIILSL